MKVVDASLATKWVLPEQDSRTALALLEEWSHASERLAAPHLWPFEMTNILRKYVLRRGLPEDDAHAALQILLAMPIQLLPPSRIARARLHREALELAARLDLPATYDAHYLALAASLDCELWTADDRLLQQLRGRLPDVRSLGEFETA